MDPQEFSRSFQTGVREECGVFGMFQPDGRDIVRDMYYGLHALQHRGQEACGIAVTDTAGPRGAVTCCKGAGLVSEVFSEEVLSSMKGNLSIGHVRYSTTGASTQENAQPLVIKYSKGSLCLAHNGNLVNTDALHRELETNGAVFQTTTDSEILAIDRDGLHSDRSLCQVKRAHCIFEYIYFARLDSRLDRISVYEALFGASPAGCRLSG